MKQTPVVVLLGVGSIGVAIARRVSVGCRLILADYSLTAAESAAHTLADAGFDCVPRACDLADDAAILDLRDFAVAQGDVFRLINAAGVSPSQASVDHILRVDLRGVAVLLHAFGSVISDGGSGVIISSQSGHRLPALTPDQDEALALTPPEALLDLPFLRTISDTLKAYQYAKRGNVLRVKGEAPRWALRGATLNSISPGIILTPLANDELRGPRGAGYREMLASSPAGRAGTPDEVGDLAEFLMSSRGRFITGADFLIDGGTTASYFYGPLRTLRASH